jgi:hypothetical protein
MTYASDSRLALAFILALSSTFAARSASAATYSPSPTAYTLDKTTCTGVLGGTWTLGAGQGGSAPEPDTCQVSTLDMKGGDSLTIPRNTRLTVDGPARSYGGIDVAVDGIFELAVDNAFANYGIVNNSGTFNNYGITTNLNAGAIYNRHRLLNEGAIFNNGDYAIISSSNSEAIIDNYGWLTNVVSGAQIINTNHSILNNRDGGLLDVAAGKARNEDLSMVTCLAGSSVIIADGATFTNTGALAMLLVQANGTLENSGMLKNQEGATLDSYGYVENDGELLNSQSSVRNEWSGQFTNKGDFKNVSKSWLSNYGTFTQSGTLTNYCDSTVSNNPGAYLTGGFLDWGGAIDMQGHVSPAPTVHSVTRCNAVNAGSS